MCFYLPLFDFNLIFVSKLSRTMSCYFVFCHDKCVVQDMPKRTIGSAKLLGGLYHVDLPETQCLRSSLVQHETISDSTICNSVSIPSTALWHFRLGHAFMPLIDKLSSQIPCVNVSKSGVCDVFYFAKQRRNNFVVSKSRASKAFDLLHMDIWGPYSIPSVHNHRYFLTVVDDFSRFTCVMLLKGNYEVQQHVQNFILLVENQFVRTDNGPEFHLPKFYNSKGISHQTSCVATPQQNARIERKHQHILNVAMALLFQSKLPKRFWNYAIQYAVYIINRVPSKVLNYDIPYTLLHGQAPDLTNLKTFGCLCFVSTHAAPKTKFDPRSKRCVFIGYKAGMKGYVVLDPSTLGITVSRDVQFHELVFPYTHSGLNNTWQHT